MRANRLPAGKIKRVDGEKNQDNSRRTITPACIQEIADIKNKNTDSEDRATLEGLEKIM